VKLINYSRFVQFDLFEIYFELNNSIFELRKR